MMLLILFQTWPPKQLAAWQFKPSNIDIAIPQVPNITLSSFILVGHIFQMSRNEKILKCELTLTFAQMGREERERK